MTGEAERLRKLILAVLLAGMAANTAELLLLGHFESRVQFIPLVTLAIGIVGASLVLIRPTRDRVGFLRVASALFISVGLAGLYFHYQGNAEFELEMYPALGGFQLFLESLQGATPALAPGVLIFFGLMGFVSTVRHPLLEERKTA